MKTGPWRRRLRPPRKRSAWLSAAACLVCAPVLAASAWGPARKLDAFVDALDKNRQVSAVIAISEKGVLRHQRAIGFATLSNGTQQPADEGTRYRIGAVSNLFTAALVLLLAEKASITLDTPVAEFFPDVPNAIDITYRDLLAHRSGLGDYRNSPGFAEWRTVPHSRDEMLRSIGGTVFEPRARLEYSATNYLLLGYVLEKVHERPYPDLVRRQIVEKLGLARTYVPGSGRSSTLEAASYLPTAQGWAPQAQTDPSVAGGASGLFSNAVDLVRFMDALFGAKLVSAQSLSSMRGEEGEPGLGMSTRQVADLTGYGRADAADGFYAAVYHFPARGITFACTSNASSLPMEKVFDEMLAALLVRGHRPEIPAAVRENAQ